jgi:hypothetical protein
MRSLDRKGRSIPVAEPSNRQKYLSISPLWTLWLITLSIVTLGMGIFALRSILGRAGGEQAIAALEWKPPSLAIVSLDPPKPANADLESVSRPIFSKSRKPALKTTYADSPANAATDTGALSVTAIVLNKKILQAFIISSDAPEGAWRKIGDTVDTWSIAAIAPKEVVIQNGGQKKVLPLYSSMTDRKGNTTGLTPAPSP